MMRLLYLDIDIADILGQKYRCRIDIGHGDIDPPLLVGKSSFKCVSCQPNTSASVSNTVDAGARTKCTCTRLYAL